MPTTQNEKRRSESSTLSRPPKRRRTRKHPSQEATPAPSLPAYLQLPPPALQPFVALISPPRIPRTTSEGQGTRSTSSLQRNLSNVNSDPDHERFTTLGVFGF